MSDLVGNMKTMGPFTLSKDLKATLLFQTFYNVEFPLLTMNGIVLKKTI